MDVDLIIIGAGINGCGIASDASGRGLKVAIVDRGDVASATSNASTKLIHGGLRYLEHFEFNLVRESLREQNWLARQATYLVKPLKFIIPKSPVRASWQVRAGLYLYDTLTKRSVPRSSSLSNNELEQLTLNETPSCAFTYYDYQTDDHRLALCDLLDARQRHAQVFLNCEIKSIESLAGYWRVQLLEQNGSGLMLRAKALINSTGPWVEQFAQQFHLPSHESWNIQLSQGSHLVVPKLYPQDQAYLLQSEDKRIIFTVPFHENTLIGTTDHPLESMPLTALTTTQEKNYLLDMVKNSFQTSLSAHDIIHTYSGVRALLKTSSQASKCSREYKLVEGLTPDKAYCLHVIGGKITTWRSLSEKAVNLLSKIFPKMGPEWTLNKLFCGARLNTTAEEITLELKNSFPHLPEALLARFAKTYGTRSYQLIGQARKKEHLGAQFGANLSEREITFLIENEWVIDYHSLIRRTRLEYFLNKKEKNTLKGLFTRSVSSVYS